MRQTSLYCPIQALWINLLHELEALHGCLFDRRPPNGSRIVDHYIQPAILLHSLLNHMLYAVVASGINGNSNCIASTFEDLSGNGINGRGGRIRIWRE